VSILVDFYRGRAGDAACRTLQQLWSWDDKRLEVVHDYIQWLFPLPEPSQFNPDAPLLTPEDIAAFKRDETLRNNLRKSYHRILTFFGLATTNTGQVVDGENLAARAPDIWEAPNHNWLRISRILRCLTQLGLEAEAQAFYAWLEEAYRSRRFPIDAHSFGYWQRAVSS
jgi:Opioid growth factor receptor (OGFr) conserved region